MHFSRKKGSESSYRFNDALCAGEHCPNNSKVFGVGHSPLAHVFENLSGRGCSHGVFGVKSHVGVYTSREHTKRSPKNKPFREKCHKIVLATATMEIVLLLLYLIVRMSNIIDSKGDEWTISSVNYQHVKRSIIWNNYVHYKLSASCMQREASVPTVL